jgi:hypothetical protein
LLAYLQQQLLRVPAEDRAADVEEAQRLAEAELQRFGGGDGGGGGDDDPRSSGADEARMWQALDMRYGTAVAETMATVVEVEREAAAAARAGILGGGRGGQRGQSGAAHGGTDGTARRSTRGGRGGGGRGGGGARGAGDERRGAQWVGGAKSASLRRRRRRRRGAPPGRGAPDGSAPEAAVEVVEEEEEEEEEATPEERRAAATATARRMVRDDVHALGFLAMMGIPGLHQHVCCVRSMQRRFKRRRARQLVALQAAVMLVQRLIQRRQARRRAALRAVREQAAARVLRSFARCCLRCWASRRWGRPQALYRGMLGRRLGAALLRSRHAIVVRRFREGAEAELVAAAMSAECVREVCAEALALRYKYCGGHGITAADEGAHHQSHGVFRKVPPPPRIPEQCPVCFTLFQLDGHAPWDGMLPIDSVSFARICTELRHGGRGLAQRAVELRGIIAAGKAAELAVNAWQEALADKRYKAQKRKEEQERAAAAAEAGLGDPSEQQRGKRREEGEEGEEGGAPGTMFGWEEAVSLGQEESAKRCAAAAAAGTAALAAQGGAQAAHAAAIVAISAAALAEAQRGEQFLTLTAYSRGLRIVIEGYSPHAAEEEEAGPGGGGGEGGGGGGQGTGKCFLPLHLEGALSTALMLSKNSMLQALRRVHVHPDQAKPPDRALKAAAAALGTAQAFADAPQHGPGWHALAGTLRAPAGPEERSAVPQAGNLVLESEYVVDDHAGVMFFEKGLAERMRSDKERREEAARVAAANWAAWAETRSAARVVDRYRRWGNDKRLFHVHAPRADERVPDRAKLSLFEGVLPPPPPEGEDLGWVQALSGGEYAECWKMREEDQVSRVVQADARLGQLGRRWAAGEAGLWRREAGSSALGAWRWHDGVGAAALDAGEAAGGALLAEARAAVGLFHELCGPMDGLERADLAAGGMLRGQLLQHELLGGGASGWVEAADALAAGRFGRSARVGEEEFLRCWDWQRCDEDRRRAAASDAAALAAARSPPPPFGEEEELVVEEEAPPLSSPSADGSDEEWSPPALTPRSNAGYESSKSSSSSSSSSGSAEDDAHSDQMSSSGGSSGGSVAFASDSDSDDAGREEEGPDDCAAAVDDNYSDD